jgi:hypothetical protein
MGKTPMSAEIHTLRTHLPARAVVYCAESNGLVEVLWRNGNDSGRLAVVAYPDVGAVVGKALADHYGARFDEGDGQ